MSQVTTLQSIEKNKAFRVYFGLTNVDEGGTSIDSILLSKDGGAEVAPTNVPVQISSGHYFVDLTASEMNADVISIKILDSVVPKGSSFIHIYTGVTVNNTYNVMVSIAIARAMAESYTFSDSAIAEAGFNYYGLNQGGKIWLIIKEAQVGGALQYAQGLEGVQPFSDAWINRATLVYSNNAKIIDNINTNKNL